MTVRPGTPATRLESYQRRGRDPLGPHGVLVTRPRVLDGCGDTTDRAGLVAAGGAIDVTAKTGRTAERSRRQERSTFTLALVVSLVAIACADAPPSGPGPDTGAQQAADPNITASCGGVRFPTLPPDPSAFEPFDRWADVDFSAFEVERGFFDGSDWFVAEETPTMLELFGQPHSETQARQTAFASASFESKGGVWTPTGFGDCRMELSAEGWGNARFELDPSAPVDPTASTVSVLATETSCASGQPPDGRAVRAVVLDEASDTVSIVMLVEPVEGGANCQGNPAFPYDVDIGSPIGERHILDASVYPPIDASAPSEMAAANVPK